jgi:protein CpxP
MMNRSRFMLSMTRLMTTAACLTLLAFVPLAAQGGPPGGPPGGRPPGGGQRGGGMPDGQRMEMERRLQERINATVRERLVLTDDQYAKLRDVASKMEDDRRALRHEEMTTRFALRQELLAGDKADEGKVAEFLERMPRYERRRLDLMEREQKELAKFLTPSQRARYIGLQDELRRSMQDLQVRRMGKDSGGAPGRAGMRRQPPPPGRP